MDKKLNHTLNSAHLSILSACFVVHCMKSICLIVRSKSESILHCNSKIYISSQILNKETINDKINKQDLPLIHWEQVV